MIKRKKIEVNEERKILSNMIVSTPFLSELKEIANPNLFKSPFSITVANWVWEYFEYCQTAPGKSIEDVYLKNRHTIQDEDENELIADFLQKLSKDWEKHKVNNVLYSVKSAIEFFKLRSLEKLKNDLEDSIAGKNPKHGESLIASYRRVEKIKGHGVNFLKDANAIKEAFRMEHEILFSYPKLLGKAMGSFKRGDFYAIMAPPKRGKTFYMIHAATWAVLMGFRVVFISLEMTEEAVLRRFWKSFTGETNKKATIDLPCFAECDDDKFEVTTKRIKKKGVNLDKITKDQRKYELASRSGDLKIQTYPSGTANLQDIKDYLTNLEYYENYIPDVIVVDYADILLPENTRMEYRHQLNSIWVGLRGLAQQKESLVITGSQTGRVGVKKDAGSGDIAEDVRKLAHVTKFAILNQNEKEKEAGILRFKVGEQRDDKSFYKELVILQGLEIGRPYLDCKVIDDVDMTPFEIKKKGKK